MKHLIHTIGHSTRGVAELVALLKAASIDLLIDVRSFPRSRRNPQFNIETLPAALAEAGIDYRHLAALGGRRQATASSPNEGWREPGFRNYADYALTPAYESGLADLLAAAEAHRVAIMCAETLWWRCHRRIITDYLLTRGVEVRHILGPDDVAPASLTPGAQPQRDGRILYPPEQPRLL